jgi:SAM-dependent methyltransferase
MKARIWVKADHYDSFAESYSTENESSLLNAYYERPAMIDLAGDVDGHRVLDAGCGSGPLSEALRTKGAIVTGVDGSPAMIELARHRLGDNAALHVADLSRPLPFDDGPIVYKLMYPDADYFAITQYSEENTFNGHSAVLTFWHRPLSAMTDAFTEAGLRISVISEPPFSPDTPRELLGPTFADRTAFLCFIFFVLEAS